MRIFCLHQHTAKDRTEGEGRKHLWLNIPMHDGIIMQNEHRLQQLLGNVPCDRLCKRPVCGDVSVEVVVGMVVHCDERGVVVFPPTLETDDEGGVLVAISRCWCLTVNFTYRSHLDHALNLPANAVSRPYQDLLHGPHFLAHRAAFAMHAAEAATANDLEPVPGPVSARLVFGARVVG